MPEPRLNVPGYASSNHSLMHITTLLRTSALALALLGTTALAAPEDFQGKPLPSMNLKYLETAPELQGKPAIVEFWATWCPPCRKSIPHLNEISKKYKEKGLVVVGITDEDKATVEKFRKGMPMEYNVALDDGSLGKKLGITGIPHAFVLDKEGKVAWHGHPMELDDKVLDGVLK